MLEVGGARWAPEISRQFHVPLGISVISDRSIEYNSPEYVPVFSVRAMCGSIICRRKRKIGNSFWAFTQAEHTLLDTQVKIRVALHDQGRGDVVPDDLPPDGQMWHEATQHAGNWFVSIIPPILCWAVPLVIHHTRIMLQHALGISASAICSGRTASNMEISIFAALPAASNGSLLSEPGKTIAKIRANWRQHQSSMYVGLLAPQSLRLGWSWGLDCCLLDFSPSMAGKAEESELTNRNQRKPRKWERMIEWSIEGRRLWKVSRKTSFIRASFHISTGHGKAW